MATRLEADQSKDLAGLLDKLVAVDLDLESILKMAEEAAQVEPAAANDAIAQACDVLRSAITDLRDLIHQTDGSAYLHAETASLPLRGAQTA
jgi:hypothetical protein